ncbi:MAG TPA: 50S ribosomal protein L9 [Phycisphaerae bacterium]|nr:50S ribosomal protein L9 [Phycisphaerae bacterium]
MKLLLKTDISRLGIVGDVVEVSDGYARNYLLPQHLATEPTEANIRALAEERKKAEGRRRSVHEAQMALAETLRTVEVTIAAAANEEGVLYGSVGPREIAAALREEGHSVETAQVNLHSPIRRLDNVPVEVRLADDIVAEVKVWVVRSRGTAAETEEDDEDAGREAGADGYGPDA